MSYPMDYGEEFWKQFAIWSNNTFGDEEYRGPRSPLLHLKKEVEEALEAEYIIGEGNFNIKQVLDLKIEIVDCFLLVFDAARRSGMTYHELINLANMKLEINKKREFPKTDPGTPSFHVKEP